MVERLQSPISKLAPNHFFENSHEDTDNQILCNLDDDDDIDPDMQIDEDEDPAIMEELEKRKEEIMEEFLDMVFQKRFDIVEAIKAECKA